MADDAVTKIAKSRDRQAESVVDDVATDRDPGATPTLRRSDGDASSPARPSEGRRTIDRAGRYEI